MSREAIKEKVLSFVKTADQGTLERLCHFIENGTLDGSGREDAPDRNSIDRGLKDTDEGKGMPHESSGTAQWPQA
jgi:hypothetical protein